MPPCSAAAPGAAPSPIRIEIDDPGGCYAYVGRVVEGVHVGPSPKWLRERLESAGVRAINNVVDVTNLVLLELGQPLHAFDLAQVRGATVRVRAAGAGEKLVTLDGIERALGAEDLVIADANGALAIAGVMGGAAAQVRETTTSILLESAHFAAERVRRTARRLALASEASYRFERGVDREGVARAADRAVRLLEEIAGGRSTTPVAIARGEVPAATEWIGLDPGRVNRLLGTTLSESEITALLERVGVRARVEAGERLRCEIPSHRNDLHRGVDLVEEIVRIYGCDRVPATLPTVRLAAVSTPAARALASRARDALAASGLHEMIGLSFGCVADLDRLGLAASDARRAVVTIANPISEMQGCLRPSLVPSLLHAARENLARRVDRVRLFEVSRVFRDQGEASLPSEPTHLTAVVVRGERASLWEPREPAPLFFEAKGIAERLLSDLGRRGEFVAGSEEPFLHPGACASIRVDGRGVGCVGEVHPEIARRFEIDRPCALVDVDLTALGATVAHEGQYRELSQQPPVRRDLALLVRRDVAAGDLLESIRKTAGRDLVGLELFDRYEGRGIPEDRMSLAFRLTFQRLDRAFTEAEITKTVGRVVAMLSHRFGAELRSGPGGRGGA